MDHWQKISASKRSRRDSVTLATTQNDQVNLISTAQGVEAPDGSWATPPSSSPHNEQGVIHKDVTVSQSYEFVK